MSRFASKPVFDLIDRKSIIFLAYHSVIHYKAMFDIVAIHCRLINRKMDRDGRLESE